jgi:hypothetical protein
VTACIFKTDATTLMPADFDFTSPTCIPGLVLLSAADFDYRLLILNWVMHAHALGHSNAIVLAMDSELAAEMQARRIPVFDDSAGIDAWNVTCLQRHIQASGIQNIRANTRAASA